jgi:hypothetical protein
VVKSEGFRVHGMYNEWKNTYNILVGNLGIDRRIILKYILDKQAVKM